MNEPNVFKQPTRADRDIQASVIAQVRHTAPEEADDEGGEQEETETRFSTSGALRTVTLVDDDTEYCADVMDEESERVWHIAVWNNPPDTELDVSHCFVVGSKGQAREILRSLTGEPEFVPNKGQQARGSRQTGYSGPAGQNGQKPGRTQQKQG